MADSDDLDLDDGGVSDTGGSKKKGGGLGNLLPSILKFVAIGLAALIFIVTVSVITFNIMNRGGRTQTIITDPMSPYIGRRPEWAMFTAIGPVTTRTRDFPAPFSVTVEMVIGYDMNDPAATSELNSRLFELRDFVRRYFASKTAAELVPEREDEIRNEIREQLNTRLLDTARARIILFTRLDVHEMF